MSQNAIKNMKCFETSKSTTPHKHVHFVQVVKVQIRNAQSAAVVKQNMYAHSNIMYFLKKYITSHVVPQLCT